MNIILAAASELQDDRLSLDDHRAKHIVKVLRAEVGDTVRVGIVDGPMGRAEILSMRTKFPFTVELRVSLNEQPVSVPGIDLVLALPRPIMLRRILSQVTTLGIGTIHLINSARVEKSFWEASLLQEDELREHLIQGLEQAAVDTRLPKVCLHRRFRPFIEDVFPQLAPAYRYKIIAHPTGAQPLGHLISSGCGCNDGSDQPDDRVVVAIGPEGGWVDYELEHFAAQGFAACTIGERILKVDTAVIALHARISALRELRLHAAR